MKGITTCGLALIAAAALLGCGQDRAPTAAPPASTPVAVSDIRIGAAGAAAQPQSPDRPIVVRLKLRGSERTTKLEARLVEPGSGTAVAVLSKQFVGALPPETEFSFESAQPWSEGRYTVEIKLDGKPVAQRAVDVARAAATP